MRIIDTLPRGSVSALAMLADGPRRRRRRPRTDDDRAIIRRMALLEVGARRAEGRLVRLGPREYELHPEEAVAVFSAGRGRARACETLS